MANGGFSGSSTCLAGLFVSFNSPADGDAIGLSVPNIGVAAPSLLRKELEREVRLGRARAGLGFSLSSDLIETVAGLFGERLAAAVALASIVGLETARGLGTD